MHPFPPGEPLRFATLWKWAVLFCYSAPVVFTQVVVSEVKIDPAIFDPHVEFASEFEKKCEIAEWNNKTLSRVPYESHHHKWVKLNKQNYPNLKDAQLRIVSAFVYRHEIVVTTSAQNRYGKPIFCRYFDCNREELNGTVFETLMFPLSAAFCARRAGAEYMSLTDTVDGPIVSDPVPLTVRVAEKYAHEVAVCVGPIYGNETRWLEIAETTEHHLIIGATYFYYTIFNKMGEYTRKLVDEYERLGYFEVTVVQNEYETMDWMTHLVQINDCHFRSRYHSKWVINVDIDERLVMLKQPLLPFLRSLSSNVGEVMFATKRIMRIEQLPEKYEGKKQLLKDLEYLKYNKTMMTTWDVPKIIFRPEKVQALFYHWTLAQHPGVRVMTVPKRFAYIRHYRTTRPSLLGIWYLGQKFNASRMDPMLEEKVTLAVTKRLETVYNQRKIRCEEIRPDLIGHYSKGNYECFWKNGSNYVDVAMGSY